MAATMQADMGRDRAARARSARYRWTAPVAAAVSHPVRGTIVVPCRSKLSAIQCAADVWRCPWRDLLTAAVLWVPPGTAVTPMPERTAAALRREEARQAREREAARRDLEELEAELERQAAEERRQWEAEERRKKTGGSQWTA